ncbi:hypothetical protein BU16DRAFT_526822 [Lophium mytilinum]|uniref:F-box domain-containing protein n=1 Tax=Lophium mytilinum TaxID=390894 RepID=A0A6A6QW31_9PEZI|nr:hypothetical protein BU16DRAFT_526822 [Lophium mytilinum]
MATITDLPSELLIDTFAYLDRLDLKAVRGVCRRFAEISTPSIFQRVLVAPRYQALGAFQTIFQHAVYHKYVKEIVYDGSVYDAGLATNEQVYMAHLSRAECDAYRLDSWGRRKRFKQYQQLYHDQEGIQDSLILFRTLERGLESLPNVTTITYSPGPRNVPIEKKEAKDILPRGEPHSTPSFGGSEGIVQQCSHRGFHYLIGALALVKYSGIRTFRVEAADRPSEPQGTIFTSYAFELPDQAQLQAGLHLFSTLHNLDLPLSLAILGTSSSIPSHLTALRGLLRGAKELRTLSLHLHKWHPSPQSWAPNTSAVSLVLGKTTTWPHLRFLSLGGVHASAQELVDLALRHASTLREVRYSRCSLIEGKWSDVVDSILRTTHIDSFEISKVHEAVVGSRIFAHLSEAEMREFTYSGQLQVGAGGERYYVPSPGHRSVY